MSPGPPQKSAAAPEKSAAAPEKSAAAPEKSGRPPQICSMAWNKIKETVDDVYGVIVVIDVIIEKHKRRFPSLIGIVT